MPGKRYNLTITRGPWKGQRARLVQQLNPDAATMQLQSGTNITIPLADFKQEQNKTPKLNTRKNSRRPVKPPSKRGRK